MGLSVALLATEQVGELLAVALVPVELLWDDQNTNKQTPQSTALQLQRQQLTTLALLGALLFHPQKFRFIEFSFQQFLRGLAS